MTDQNPSSLKSLSDFNASRQHLYGSYSQCFFPYVVGSKQPYMSTHPLSVTRLKHQSIVNKESVLADRERYDKLQKQTPWFPSEKSMTFNPISTKPYACEFASRVLLSEKKSRHIRSDLEPCDKFDRPICTSHEVTWGKKNETYSSDTSTSTVSTSGSELLLNNKTIYKPTHGIHDSERTRFYNNLYLTHSYHILR